MRQTYYDRSTNASPSQPLLQLLRRSRTHSLIIQMNNQKKKKKYNFIGTFDAHIETKTVKDRKKDETFLMSAVMLPIDQNEWKKTTKTETKLKYQKKKNSHTTLCECLSCIQINRTKWNVFFFRFFFLSFRNNQSER